MINIGLYYKVKKGSEAEFESIFNDVVSHLKKNVQGFQDAKIYRKVGEDEKTTEYMLYSEWSDLDAFREFINSDAFRNTTSHGKSIIEGRPYHKIFKEIIE